MEEDIEKERQKKIDKRLKKSKRASSQGKQARPLYQELDTKEFLVAQQKKELKRESMRRISWQVCTMSIAMSKLYIISLVQGSMTIYNT